LEQAAVAGPLFLVFGVAFVVYFKLYRSLSIFLTMGLPIFLIGALFLAFRSRKRAII